MLDVIHEYKRFQGYKYLCTYNNIDIQYFNAIQYKSIQYEKQ